MNFTLSHAEYDAVDQIEGMHPGAHLMVATAKPNDDGTWTMTGEPMEFRGLLSTIREEVDEQVCSKAAAKDLERVIGKVERLLGHRSGETRVSLR